MFESFWPLYKSTFNMDMVANEFCSSPFFKIIILKLNLIYIGHICKLLCFKPKTRNLQRKNYGLLKWYEAISRVFKSKTRLIHEKIATVRWFLTMQCGYVELSSQLCCLCTLGQQFLGCFGMITIWHPAPGSTTKGNMQKPNSL